MAGYAEDPSLWRLRTDGGIPFKYLGISGSFSMEEGNVTNRYLIQPGHLVSFLQELFPPPLVIGNTSIPQSAPLPGLPALIAQRISFKSFDESLPIDPFGFDTNAPAGTYYNLMEVDIEFGPRAVQEPQQNDPFSFLEITGNTTGEFIHSTMPRAKWVPKTNPDLDDDDDDEDPEGGVADPDTNEPGSGAVNPTEGTPEVNKDPTVPVTIVVPQTEWTLRWNQIPFRYFQEVLIHRLRILLGRVNSNTVPVLFNALPGTLLFAGYNYSNAFTWRDGHIGTPPVSLEIKIIEKRVLWKGVIRGHNDFWRPGVGWETLLIDGENPAYRSWDYSTLFSV
jgi:hypothetical protein